LQEAQRSNADGTRRPPAGPDVDVLVVGGGLTGIGFATRLRRELPDRSLLVVDAHEDVGGTWHLFRYPGVRSDSDLITYGYQYKPWTKEKAIAPGADIKRYVQEAVQEHGLTDDVRLGRRVQTMDWCSRSGTWTVTMAVAATGQSETVTARWVVSATGYFDHQEGYRPRFDGEEDFRGLIVHPQDWPEDLDYRDKQVVVIGSGATAVTLLPALAQEAALVTMLQRSPSYVLPLPSKDLVFNALHRVLPTSTAFEVTRKANIQRLRLVVSASRRYPRGMRRLLRRINKALLPASFDVDTHFNPSYDPWDQRMCIVPDADLYGVLRTGRAAIATDRIRRFVPDGIELESGQFLSADVVVTATGLNLLPFGGIAVRIDGRPLAWADTVAYKSVMLSDVPNFLFGLGYTNNSWTLKIDLASTFLTRLLAHMERHGYDTVVPRLEETGAARDVLLDDLTSGYLQRGVAAFPRLVRSGPWTYRSHYGFDVERLGGAVDGDDALVFGRAGAVPPLQPAAAAAPAVAEVPVAVGGAR
jgi:cation diffusion facilitator CzcD-associated flavoprotein CzcO